MKKIVTIFAAIAAMMCLCISADARRSCGDDWKEKLMAEKIAFLTLEVGLTPEEAQVFFFLGLWVGWNACRFLLRLAAGIWLSSALKTQALRKPCNKHQILDPSIQSILHPDGEELVFIRTPSVAENAFDLASEDQGLSSLYD